MKKSRIEAWDSVDIDNYAYNGTLTDEELHEFMLEASALHHARHKFPDRDTGKPRSLVEFVKGAMGPQDYTWVGEFRFWVWERGAWRLLVNNHKGLCIELRQGLTKEQVLEAWKDIRMRLGCAEPFPRGTHVLAYDDDRPGVYVGPDPDYPGSFIVKFEDGSSTTTGHDNIYRDDGDRFIPARVADRLGKLGWTVTQPHPWFTECLKDGIQIVLSASAMSGMSAHSAWTSMNTWKQIRERNHVAVPGNAMGNEPTPAEKEAIAVILEEAFKEPTWE